MKLTVACVLRSGGRYGVDDVRKLYGMVRRNLSHFDRFVCLSDVAFEIEGVERVALQHGFRGWWSKIELWRPDVFAEGERVLYLDLDTIILQNINALAARSESFVALRDFYWKDRLGSGLMLCTPYDHAGIYFDFIAKPALIVGTTRRGDQEWIEQNLEDWTRWQDVLPGKVLSFRTHLDHGKIQPPPTASVIAFHGAYKPHDYGRLPWVKEHWAA